MRGFGSGRCKIYEAGQRKLAVRSQKRHYARKMPWTVENGES